MRRAARQRSILLAVVAVLAALTWWSVARRGPAPPASLLAIDPAAVAQITVRAGDGVQRRFEKRADGWWMTAPRQARANPKHLARLADIAAAEVVRWRPASDFDPAKIGLAKPFAVLELNGQRLVFGGLGALAAQRYVKVGSHVALIGARHAADLAATPDSELAPAVSASAP